MLVVLRNQLRVRLGRPDGADDRAGQDVLVLDADSVGGAGRIDQYLRNWRTHQHFAAMGFDHPSHLLGNDARAADCVVRAAAVMVEDHSVEHERRAGRRVAKVAPRVVEDAHELGVGRERRHNFQHRLVEVLELGLVPPPVRATEPRGAHLQPK
ncbi:hypothetical protein, variant 3 [Aphanomyces astaci]|nr:hypothetical protein, variant 2 [Aphanomyces astaci]XP_009839317.1 hypothetical protein, variant 4 [Aphanomyces astaci]XP_009839318.1 hypothetical protein, variant 5 [Aphanomyces astaci]XP_009839319.1 hypothetical protein, variant 6 [Aphanomyces astaci]XP_009839320.1 hypothetical protein, variant 7 [Aphanomyces astaci]XP_009839321.1 hypothetical protein, variant 8 [Aphanomyces astaci]XP_009839322.1 hypothetical protein, variant 9 [Aphanomyces astaci]XP_009839323.1 hypothetical protein, va|eukprot:XP_009839314.1 hypothetical protein, variant 2 [Aphanomyces astaci]